MINLNSCGSGLARDDVITVNCNVECQTAIAGKPAPTVFCGDQEVHGELRMTSTKFIGLNPGT